MPSGCFQERGGEDVGIIGGNLGYRLLRMISPDGSSSRMDGSAYASRSKLEILFGPGFWQVIADKTVIDFGCGSGAEAIEMAARGARQVIGIDIQEPLLTHARARAQECGLASRCQFMRSTAVRADIVTAVDSFEHFDDPAGVLEAMRDLIRDDGRVLVSFGPTWLHPLGGHLFSVFPWAHLLFTEAALIRWRSDFKSDGATKFHEVAGGLNQMTIGRFIQTVEASPFRLEQFEAVPIRKLRPIANRLTREFTTAIVRCTLVPRQAIRSSAPKFLEGAHEVAGDTGPVVQRGPSLRGIADA